MKQLQAYIFNGFFLISVLLAVTALIFSACDESTNPVTQNTKPVIVLLGDSVMTITEKDHFTDPGAMALDAEDGDLTGSIVVNYGLLDTSNAAVGTYTITYSVQDSKGDSASATRKVIVTEEVLPDTVLITTPLANPSVFSDTTVTYKIPSSLTIPTGYSVTLGANTRVVVLGNVSISGALVIGAGAHIMIAEGIYFKVTTGSLNINGTVTDTVFFTNYESGKYWGHDGSDSYYSYAIQFDASANATSSITYCVIDSGTTGLNIRKDGLTITNTTIRHSKYAGMYFYQCGPKDSASFLNNAFLANGSSSTFYPLVIGADYLNRLSGTGTFTGNAAQAIRVEDATVSITGRWKKHSVPYVFEGSTVINNTSAGVVITVDTGTVMQFKESASLKIDAATFIAAGTATSPIVFSNYENGKYWGHDGSDSYYSYALFFTANANASSMLQYCTVDSGTTGINVRKDGLTISNTTVSHSKFAGIYFYQCGPADSASFLNNTFTENSSSSTYYPLAIGADYLNRLSGTGTFTGNSAQAIRVENATVTVSGVWKKHAVPYVFEGETKIHNTNGVEITVRPGTVLKFKEEAYLIVDAATFIAKGTAASPISFLNYETGTIWGHDGTDSYYSHGIKFTENANVNSALDYCVIDSSTTGVNVKKDGLAISNTTVSHSKYAGMYFYQCGPKDSTTFLNNSFTGNGSSNLFYPLRIPASHLHRLSGTSVFTTNTNDAIFVDDATVETSGAWKKQTVPYVFDGSTVIHNDNGVVISIHPGTAFKFLVDATIEVRNATLTAVGTATDSITFANFVDGQYWGKDSDAGYYSYGLIFNTEANAASTVSFCAFTMATQALNIRDVAVTVSNCSISNSKYWGLYTYKTGNTNIGTISYSGNGSGDQLHED